MDSMKRCELSRRRSVLQSNRFVDGVRLIALACLISASSLASRAAAAAARPQQCLQNVTSPVTSSADAASGSSLDGDLEWVTRGTASIRFEGCLPVSEILPRGNVSVVPSIDAQHFPIDTVNWAASPDVSVIMRCAADCAQTPSTTALRPAGTTYGNAVRFLLLNASTCLCINSNQSVATFRDEFLAIPTPRTYESCSSSTVAHRVGVGSPLLQNMPVFLLTMPCAQLSAASTGGCGSSCSLEASSGCCQPTATSAPANGAADIPNYYRSMIQWVAIVVIILAVLEAIAYGCLRRRRANAPRRRRTEGGPRRTKREAADLAERLLSLFPASPTAAQEPTIAEDACPICLDPLVDSPSLMMPCHHHIHATCLKNFVAHQLSRSNEVNCPMCRFAIVEEDAVEEEEDVRHSDGSDGSEDEGETAQALQQPQRANPAASASASAARQQPTPTSHTIQNRPRRTSSLLGRPQHLVSPVPGPRQEYTAISVLDV